MNIKTSRSLIQFTPSLSKGYDVEDVSTRWSLPCNLQRLRCVYNCAVLNVRIFREILQVLEEGSILSSLEAELMHICSVVQHCSQTVGYIKHCNAVSSLNGKQSKLSHPSGVYRLCCAWSHSRLLNIVWATTSLLCPIFQQLFTQVTKLQEELDGRESGMDLQGGMEKSRKSNVSDMYQPSRNSSASHFGGVDAGGAQQIMGGMLQNNMQSPMMQVSYIWLPSCVKILN